MILAHSIVSLILNELSLDESEQEMHTGSRRGSGGYRGRCEQDFGLSTSTWSHSRGYFRQVGRIQRQRGSCPQDHVVQHTGPIVDLFLNVPQCQSCRQTAAVFSVMYDLFAQVARKHRADGSSKSIGGDNSRYPELPLISCCRDEY